ncbi:hypothetical protein CLOM_g7451 [Closterium sp. NIES-68]|nr:hypothetical protein CLOM_g7451 [Closterium sp. NIES-68]GJP81019.1 hypothetical protein CLOP_g11202 [Closterium sp. NIES-67]
MGSREGYGSGGERPFMSARARSSLAASQRRDLDHCSFLEPGNEFSRRPSLLNDNLDGARPSQEFARRPSLLSDNLDPFRSSARAGPSLSSLTGSSLDPVDAALSHTALASHSVRGPAPPDAATAGLSGTGVADATRSVERYMSYLSGHSSRRPAAYAPPSALAIPSVAAPSGNALSPTSEPEGNMRRHRSRRRAMQEDRLGHLAGRTHMQHSRSANACERGFMSGGEGGPGRYERMGALERMSLLSGAVSESEGGAAISARAAPYLMRRTPVSGSVETSPEAVQAYRSSSDKRMGATAAAAVAAVTSASHTPTPPASGAALAAGGGGMGGLGGMQAGAVGGPVPPGAGRSDGSMSDHSFMSARSRASLALMHRRSLDTASPHSPYRRSTVGSDDADARQPPSSSTALADAAASGSAAAGPAAGGLAPTPPVGPFEAAPPLVRRRTYSAADGSSEIVPAGMEQNRTFLPTPPPRRGVGEPSAPRGRRRATAPEVSDEVAKKVREYNEAIRRDRRALRVETAAAAAAEQQIMADGSDPSIAPSPLPPTSSTSVSAAPSFSALRVCPTCHQHWPLAPGLLSPAVPATAASTPSTATTPAALSTSAAVGSDGRGSDAGGPGQGEGEGRRAGDGGRTEGAGCGESLEGGVVREEEGDVGGAGKGDRADGEGDGEGRDQGEAREVTGREDGDDRRGSEERGGEEKVGEQESGEDGGREESVTAQQGQEGEQERQAANGGQSGATAAAGSGESSRGVQQQQQRQGMSHRSQPSLGNTSGSSGYVSPLPPASPRPQNPTSPPPPVSSHPPSLHRPMPPSTSAPGSGALSSAPGSQRHGVPAVPAVPGAPPAVIPTLPAAAAAVVASEQWAIDFNELRLGIRVGIGSFGEVFRAVWRGTEVAVKRLLLQDDPSPEEYEDFYNEISLLSRLRHPNVLLFMGACVQHPQLCMVTEYMHMGSLYRIIHSREPGQGGESLSWKRRYKMLRDICRGMLCVQRMSIVHRDLKSANCLVDKHWCVKICDFGLSRLAPDGHVVGRTAAGTPEWMAPELLRNEVCSFKCDVFSMGVIMWELVTLRRPWEDVKNPLEVAYAVAHRNARLPVPDGMLGQLIADCWEDDPERRPNFEQILERLHECEYLDA